MRTREPGRERSRGLRARISACAFAALLAAFLAAPAGADAAVRFVIKGAAWGHGAGMSQYGAYGFAMHGRSHREILRHYYRHTRIREGRGRDVRVLLYPNAGSIPFEHARRACGRRLNPDRHYRFTREGSDVVLRRGGGRRLANCGGVGKASPKGGVIKAIGKGRYRGRLIGRSASGGGLHAINEVGIEGYLKGVIPNEMPASWPGAALRAQADAARSYALATRVAGEGFDLYDDTRSQVYGGKSSETASTNEAVRQTKHQVVKHSGKVAVTFFFSTSGGETENVEYVFLGSDPKPYLKAVNDPYDDLSPYHRWRVTYSRGEMESRLGGLFSGRLRRIDVLKRGESPRIVRARVVGSAGSSKVTGPTLRDRLGLRSTWARFRKRS